MELSGQNTGSAFGDANGPGFDFIFKNAEHVFSEVYEMMPSIHWPAMDAPHSSVFD